MKKTLISALLAFGLVGTAAAQSSEQSENIVSATGVVTFQVNEPANRATLWLRGANIESATIVYRNASNQVLQENAVAVGTTYTSVTLPAPQFATRIQVSPTTLTAADAISATFIQSRDVGISRF
jgi:hypothetical protein